MECLVMWDALDKVITPYAPASKNGSPAFAVQTMLRIHFMQQRFTLSNPAIEEALHDNPMFREFAGLKVGQRMPDDRVNIPVKWKN